MFSKPSKMITHFFRLIGYWFPIVLMLFLFDLTKKDEAGTVLANGLMLIGFFLLISFFKPSGIKRFIQIHFLILFNVCIAFQLIHYELFQGLIRTSTMYVVFETNVFELKDFFEAYIVEGLWWGGVFLLGLLISVYFNKTIGEICFYKKGLLLRGSIALLVLVILFQLRLYSFPHL